MKINKKHQNFFLRSVTGIIMVVALLASILWHPAAFFLVCFVITLIALREFYLLVDTQTHRPQKVSGLIAGATLLVLAYLNARGFIDAKGFSLIIPVLIGIFIAEMYRKSPLPYQNIAYTLTGLLYVVAPFISLYYAAFVKQETGYSPALIAGFFVFLWAQDTGAYISGTLFGKNPLFSRISPNKTIEGFIGGMILVLGASIIFAYTFPINSHTQWLFAAIIISVFSTFGDLAESMLKRSADVKDSGKILPGHGGMLDRFDGVLFAAPMYYFYLQLIHS